MLKNVSRRGYAHHTTWSGYIIVIIVVRILSVKECIVNHLAKHSVERPCQCSVFDFISSIFIYKKFLSDAFSNKS